MLGSTKCGKLAIHLTQAGRIGGAWSKRREALHPGDADHRSPRVAVRCGRRHRGVQVNWPCLRDSVRNSRRRASFMFKTWTVARPAALIPLMRAPSKTKWSDQRIAPRMKKGYHLPRLGVDSSQIRAFVQMAAVACQREIIGIVGAPVLLRNDVLNMMLRAALFLVQTAIFAERRQPADGRGRVSSHPSAIESWIPDVAGL